MKLKILIALAILSAFLGLKDPKRILLVSHQPAVTSTPSADWSPGPVDSQQKSDYWSMMAEGSGFLNTKLSAYTHPANDDDGLTHTYYDATNGQFRLADHFSDTSTYYPRAAEADEWYNDYYCLDMSPNGQVQGYRQFPEGLAENYIRRSDADSKTCLDAILVNGAFTASGDLSDDLLCRENAYGLETHIEAPRTGTTLSGAQVARRDQMMVWALGHITQFVNQTADYLSVFMGGLTAQALIKYYENVSQDSRIIPAIESLANYSWSCCWNAGAKAFSYRDKIVDGAADLDPQPDLNALISPMYAWLWYKTGKGEYAQMFDQIFAGSIPVYSGTSHISGPYLGAWSAAGISGKQYNQQVYWFPKGLEWREARTTGYSPYGAPTPTPTTTPTATPTTTPTATPTPDLDALISASSPKTWFDGDHGITESGGSISAWASRVNSVTFTAAGAAQPTFTTQGGFNVVQFDGSNDYLGTTSQMTALVGASAKTVLLVFKNSAVSGHHLIFVTGTGTFGFMYNVFTGSGDFNVDNYDGSYDYYTQQSANTNLNLLEINHNGTTLSSRINNGTLGSVASGASTSTTNTWAIGAGTDGSNKWPGYVYLLVTWDSVLAEGTFGPIRSAVASKFGITLN